MENNKRKKIALIVIFLITVVISTSSISAVEKAKGNFQPMVVHQFIEKARS